MACVLTFREDFEAPWAQAQSAVEIELGPLGEDDVRTMAAAASATGLDGDALPAGPGDGRRRPLVRRGDGEAARRAPADRGGLQPISVPPTLQGLLTERLDRLSGLAELIDQAAVLGREFDRRLLRALIPLDVAGFAAPSRSRQPGGVATVEGYDSRLNSPMPCSRRPPTAGSCVSAAASFTRASPRRSTSTRR